MGDNCTIAASACILDDPALSACEIERVIAVGFHLVEQPAETGDHCETHGHVVPLRATHWRRIRPVKRQVFQHFEYEAGITTTAVEVHVWRDPTFVPHFPDELNYSSGRIPGAEVTHIANRAGTFLDARRRLVHREINKKVTVRAWLVL